MAGSVNKVILVGNLGRDPEIRYAQDGTKIVNMSVATSESWKDRQSGERRERTEWHRVVIFNDRLADVAERFLRKGSTVYLEGALQTRKWTGQDGVEKYTTDPDTFDMIFMDVQMPEMDGLTATRKIRNWEEKHRRHIPIVAFTANAMKGDRELCIGSGMDDYVAKPIQVDTVLSAIKKWTAQSDPVCC